MFARSSELCRRSEVVFDLAALNDYLEDLSCEKASHSAFTELVGSHNASIITYFRAHALKQAFEIVTFKPKLVGQRSPPQSCRD